MNTQQRMELLQKVIDIINPKEKATTERLRVLNGRLKDYEPDEIIGSAMAFSKSVWHKENKQMSVDNLIAPSKFGRWYLLREEVIDKQAEDVKAGQLERYSDAMMKAFQNGESMDEWKATHNLNDF